MRLEPTPRSEQVLRVSAKLITSSNILHLSSDELERAVNQEQVENPALEVIERRICLFCGIYLYGRECAACGRLDRTTQPLPPLAEAREEAIYVSEQHASYYQPGFLDTDNYGFAQADSDDAYDPLASIALGETLAEALLQQLEALVSPDDAPIAEQLVGNLNERGYLEINGNEIAEYLEVPLERVEYVLQQLQTLEPLGIGARNLRECLLIQLQALSEQEELHPLAYTVIDCYIEQLGHNQFREIARALKQPEQEIRQASLYIRSRLHPFPAHIYKADMRYGNSSSAATYIRPDILIRSSNSSFEVELIEERRYRFTIKTDYPTQQPDELMTNEVRHYMHAHSDAARFFVDCIQRRWRTLKRVAEFVVDYQREFLEKGVRYLRPLTRAEVAMRLSLDEGTVSRATANKYLLLPNGRLIPLADVFDGSLGVKDILRSLIQAEDPKHRLSDEELARLLTARGIPMARRTITKYREEMGIGSSRER